MHQCRENCVAGGDRVIDSQRLELGFDVGQARQPPSTFDRVVGDEQAVTAGPTTLIATGSDTR